MKKILIFCIALFPLISSQAKQEISIDLGSKKQYTNPEFKVKFTYPKDWVAVRIEKFKKKYILIKKPGAVAQIKIQYINLAARELFKIESEKFRDNVVRMRVIRGKRGLNHRKITSKEKKLFNVEKGWMIRFQYIDKYDYGNEAQLYFLLKKNRMLVVESYFEIYSPVKYKRKLKYTQKVIKKERKLIHDTLKSIKFE